MLYVSVHGHFNCECMMKHDAVNISVCLRLWLQWDDGDWEGTDGESVREQNQQP